ncbi:MAG: asparagine synthase (glutamine-hydrolyzing), partial [Saprospiraceae bacterium]|nr:asparagine synthase (glutamine-hydrolyzing) [Saprospiraceae bacterium]
MCGIAGIFNFSSSSIDISSKITAMTKALAHRGPDGEGFYFDGNITALGHRRLAIIDCSQAAHQPMQYEHLYLIFNGEIYNYVEIRAQLLNIGYTFVSNSDAEVLLKAYHHWGEDCLSHFEGMFAFAIWNSISNRLFIARDRFGEKPLFYTVQNGVFYFASEIKAFFATGIIPEINKSYFCQFLSGVKSKKIAQLTDTYFENIYQLAPASYIYLDTKSDHKIVAHKYWDINIFTEKIQFENAENKLRDHLMKSISMRLRSDVPLGNSLSGGLDSSTIV